MPHVYPATSVAGLTPTPTAAIAGATPTVRMETSGTPIGAPIRRVAQVLRLGSPEPLTLDPGHGADAASLLIIGQLFEGLVGQDANGEIVPLVAERWDVSADGLTYTFHLRQGPRWSDGKPVTARDFEWAWKRNLDPITASTQAEPLLAIRNAERIYLERNLDPQELGVTAANDRTLVVELERPAAHFLANAALPALLPLRQDTVERNGEAWVEAVNILTNGPFQVREWTHGVQIVLERDPDYWGSSPTIERAIVQLFPANGVAEALIAYESGELDVLTPAFRFTDAQSERLRKDPSLGYQDFDRAGSGWIAVNHRRAPLSDPRVRKALGMAIERTRMIDQMMTATIEQARGLQPRGVAGGDPTLWPGEDVAAARALLTAAGFPGGEGLPEIVYTYPAGSEDDRCAEYLQRRWNETLGVKLRLNRMEPRAFGEWRSGTEWEQSGDLFRGGWSSASRDPFEWFNLLWRSASDSSYPRGGWNDATYDAAVEQGAIESDPDLRRRHYERAERILAEQYPAIPLWHDRGQVLIKPYVIGATPAQFAVGLSLATMRIEPN